MLNYFNKDFTQAKGRVIDPSFKNITNVVIKNHLQVQQRYISGAHHVGPTHLLYRILTGLGIYSDMDTTTMDIRVRERARAMAGALNVTSPTSYGDTFTDQFMTSGVESVIFTYERYEKGNWEQLSPVTFLYHTNTNLDFTSGRSSDDNAYGFVKINVTMLAYQYLCWLRYRRLNDLQQNIYNFIAKYPIFNSLKSYMDISLFNRHYYLLLGKEVRPDPKRQVYPVPDIDKSINRIAEKHIDDMSKRGITIGSALYNTPGFFTDSALDLTSPVRTITTQQIEWFLFTCRLPYLHYGLHVSDTAGQSMNRSDIGNLRREINAFINSRTLTHVPKHMKLHIIETYLENILVLLL